MHLAGPFSDHWVTRAERGAAGLTSILVDGAALASPDDPSLWPSGLPLFVGWSTGRDAASVAALRETGAVILGKVLTTEFAGTEPRGTRNPWDSGRTPGRSSSGSAAAVTCGMVPAALGTQVVGSILRPASFCGCVGFKGAPDGGRYAGLVPGRQWSQAA
jgi:Asp-tRNA(Asn)/Glu-tRNA(Gln) amidotransferase A subunit family amidase